MLAFEAASTLQIDYVVAAWWIYQSYFHLKVDIELSFESQFSRAALLETRLSETGLTHLL